MAFGFDGSKVVNNAMKNASYTSNMAQNIPVVEWQLKNAKTPEDYKAIDAKINAIQKTSPEFADTFRRMRDRSLANKGITGEKRYLYIDPTSNEDANREQTFDTLKNESQNFYTGQETADNAQIEEQTGLVNSMTGILEQKAIEKKSEIDNLRAKGLITTQRYNEMYDEIKNSLADNQRQIDGGLTLAEYGNPDNKVMQATKSFYDKEANQENQRGVDNYGTLSALGAQSMNAYQNSPMSVGQQMSRAALSGRQASEAFNQAQKRIQALRDQGLNKGFEMSDNVYKATEKARQNRVDMVQTGADINGKSADSEKDFTKQITGMQNEVTDMEMRPKQMKSSLSGWQYELNKNRKSAQFNNKNAQTNALFGARGGKFSTEAAKEQANQANSTATDSSQRAFAGSVLGGLLGAGGQVAGSAVGKP